MATFEIVRGMDRFSRRVFLETDETEKSLTMDVPEKSMLIKTIPATVVAVPLSIMDSVPEVGGVKFVEGVVPLSGVPLTGVPASPPPPPQEKSKDMATNAPRKMPCRFRNGNFFMRVFPYIDGC
ncbi:MAG: hypothetical protein HKP58_10930 [Desulfatitalea sp.]|nr:hypothetical protein [Desulfatitalea sp.]NNK00914.1 hypothetical protein [Desulfatitalea sp.]